MMRTIELTPEEDAKLLRRASRARMTPEEYLRRPLGPQNRTHTPVTKRKPDPSHKSAAEASAAFDAATIDLPGGYGDPAIDSPKPAEQLRDRFSHRDRPA